MPELERQLLNKYLNQSKYYFEYGSGGSTYEAARKSNIIKIYSVESDEDWIDKLLNVELYNKVKFIYVNIGASGNWGYPGSESTYDDWIKYSKAFINIGDDRDKIDTVLIDGRFRVACVLNLFKYINEEVKIIFDDFLDRSYYHIVLNYFNIIDQAGRMVILQKRNVIQPHDEVIKFFESDAR